MEAHDSIILKITKEKPENSRHNITPKPKNAPTLKTQGGPSTARRFSCDDLKIVQRILNCSPEDHHNILNVNKNATVEHIIVFCKSGPAGTPAQKFITRRRQGF